MMNLCILYALLFALIICFKSKNSLRKQVIEIMLQLRYVITYLKFLPYTPYLFGKLNAILYSFKDTLSYPNLFDYDTNFIVCLSTNSVEIESKTKS